MGTDIRTTSNLVRNFKYLYRIPTTIVRITAPIPITIIGVGVTAGEERDTSPNQSSNTVTIMAKEPIIMSVFALFSGKPCVAMAIINNIATKANSVARPATTKGMVIVDTINPIRIRLMPSDDRPRRHNQMLTKAAITVAPIATSGNTRCQSANPSVVSRLRNAPSQEIDIMTATDTDIQNGSRA